MEITVQVDEATIQDALARKVRVAVAQYAETYEAQEYLSVAIKKAYTDAVDSLIAKVVADAPKFRAMIEEELRDKIYRELTTKLKKSGVRV